MVRGILALLLAAISGPQMASAYVELHAHPFMDEGMGILFRGSFFDDELKAKDWTARFSSQMNQRTLEESKIGLLVVSLYAHPFLNLSTKASIREQIALTREFIRRNSDRWELALNPAQAKAAAAKGKRLIVLALEGAAGVLETEADLVEFIDEGGVRIVTLLHLTDDHFGGVAFLKGIRGLFSPFAYLGQFFNPGRDEAGVRINRNGLSANGHELTEKLIARRVWIDLAHASDEAVRELLPLVGQKGMPLIFTHTVMRKYFSAERAISNWQLEEVRKSEGIVGIMPSEEFMAGTKGNLCPKGCLTECPEGIFALAAQVSEMQRAVGDGAIFFGSDFNGGIPHLKTPRSCGTNTEFDQHGLWHVGHTPLVWDALKALGAVSGNPETESVPKFLGIWEKYWRAAGLAGRASVNL